MSNIDFLDLLWQVRAEVPGIPEPTLYLNFIKAVQEHLKDTKAWSYSVVGAIDWASGDAFPSLSGHIPSDTFVVQPIAVKWEDTGRNIEFRTRDQLDQIDASWETRTASIPEYWTAIAPRSFYLYPANTAAQTAAIRLRVALANELPKGSDLRRTSIPESLADEFSDHWTHGALARLLRMPGKDWTNSQLAVNYQDMFEQDKRDARSRVAADFGRPKRQVQYGGLPMGDVGPMVRDDYGN